MYLKYKYFSQRARNYEILLHNQFNKQKSIDEKQSKKQITLIKDQLLIAMQSSTI